MWKGMCVLYKGLLPKKEKKNLPGIWLAVCWIRARVGAILPIFTIVGMMVYDRSNRLFPWNHKEVDAVRDLCSLALTHSLSLSHDLYPLSREILSKLSIILRAVCNSIRDLITFYIMFVHTHARCACALSWEGPFQEQGLVAIQLLGQRIKGWRPCTNKKIEREHQLINLASFPLAFFYTHTHTHTSFLSLFVSLSLSFFPSTIHNGFLTRNGKHQQESTALGGLQQTPCHCFKRPHYQQVRFQNVVWRFGCCIERFEENDVVHLDRLAR